MRRRLVRPPCYVAGGDPALYLKQEGRRRSRHPVNSDSRYTFVETCAAQPFCCRAAR